VAALVVRANTAAKSKINPLSAPGTGQNLKLNFTNKTVSSHGGRLATRCRPKLVVKTIEVKPLVPPQE
jgi:hypothetical protein